MTKSLSPRLPWLLARRTLSTGGQGGGRRAGRHHHATGVCPFPEGKQAPHQRPVGCTVSGPYRLLLQSGGIWIILVEELPHVPVLTTFLPSPAPPIIAAAAEHEYQDDYHNKERR